MKQARIGVLINSLFDTYEAQIWQDIVKITTDNKMSFVCFAVREFQEQKEINPDNYLYKMINPANIDALITFSNTLSSYTSIDALKSFYSSLAPVPIVNIGIKMEGYPGVTVDNDTGMKEIISHLIEKHNCRSLAFIKGAPGNQESDIRFAVYKEMLTHYGIPYNEQLVVQGNFLKESGCNAIRKLLDERKVKPDAVISANDAMALNAIKTLQERGYHIPENIAVTGFDDIAESRCGALPLTTVRQPVFEIARATVELLRMAINGREVPPEVVLPAIVKIRRSCGCFMHTEPEDKSAAGLLTVHSREKTGEEDLSTILLSAGEQVKKSLSNLRITDNAFPRDENSVQAHNAQAAAWIDELVSSLNVTLVNHKNRKSFLLLLENIILNSMDTGTDVLQWYTLISLLFKIYGTYIKTGTGKDFLDTLWMQSLDLIDNIADYRYVQPHIDYPEVNRRLHIISEALKNVFDHNKLTEVILDEFQELGIMRFFLSKYTLKEDSTCTARLLFGYDENGKIKDAGKPYPLEDILPACIRNNYIQASFILFPLYINRRPFGFAAYHTGTLDGPLFESITIYLNNALQGANLFNQAKQQTLELETKALLQDHMLESTNQRVLDTQTEKTEILEILEKKEQEIRELKKQLAIRSKMDRFTNLYNREALFDFLKREINRTQRNVWRINRVLRNSVSSPLEPVLNLKSFFGYFSVIMIFINEFKAINVEYGPGMGDRILIRISNILKREELLRKEDIAGRFADEELIIILPNTNEYNAFSVAERITNEIENLIFDQKVRISVSVGIAEYSPDEKDEFAVIRHVHTALDYARSHCGNRIIMYKNIMPPVE